MNLLNFIIPTAGLWILDSTVVMPLARRLSAGSAKKTGGTNSVWNGGHRLSRGTSEITGMTSRPAPMPGVVESEPALGIYIFISVAVLGIAGIVAGLAGYPMIGLSTRARSWPGMLAMIFGSFLGAAISGTEL